MANKSGAEPERKDGPGVAGMGCGCVGLILVGLYVAAGINNFFNPPRPERLPEPVRAVENSAEKAVRRELEHSARSAIWQGGRGGELPPPSLVGPEPRPGVSRLNFCNRLGKRVWLLFDGAEIFKLELAVDAAAAIELKSGTYDYLVFVPGGQGGDMPIAPYFRRVDFKGEYHEVMKVAGDAPVNPCPDQYQPVRQVR